MNKLKLVSASVIIICIGVVYFLPDEPKIKNEAMTTKKIEKKPVSLSPISHQTSNVASPQPVSFKQTIHESAALIADDYARSIAFPEYSQPLSLNDFSILNPNHFEPVSMITQNNSIKVNLALNKYHYVEPESISVKVYGTDIFSVKLKVQDADSRETLLQSTMSRSNDIYSTDIKGSSEFPSNLQITAIANVNGDEIPLVAQITYAQKSATITGGKEPFVESSDLVFPVELSVEKPGLYRIRANLFNGEHPIALLTEETKLSKGTVTAYLRAHHSVLPNVSSLELKTFIVEKRSTHPTKPAQFGNSIVDELIFDNIDLSSIDRTNHEMSENEKKRLKFLQTMANGR